jgi:sugar/nucleoside kinase (ribokinase family)
VLMPGARATIALGWQGLLRVLRAGEPVRRRQPWSSALLARASLVGASLHDLPRDYPLALMATLFPVDTELLLTAGPRGGALFRLGASSHAAITYPAVPSAATVDATGAGDVALAALLAARLADRGASSDAAADWAASRRRHLLFAAAAASLTVEREGVHGVPTLAEIRRLLEARHAEAQPA